MTDEAELKAGHAPANIVGGRRVPVRNDDKNNDSTGGGEVVQEESANHTMREFTDNNLPAKMEKAYPTEGVRHTHEKIVPTHQTQSIGATRANAVQRNIIPRKQTH